MNLIQLIEEFPDNEACRQHLIRVRWPEGVKCPRCHADQVSELKGRKQWTCLECRYRFSATSGTIFHQTHIGLRKWFIAIFIVINAKKSLSSLQMKRELKISQECCWHMIHRIREAMREGSVELFKGGVQMDEFFGGGPPRRTTPTSTTDARPGRGTTRPIVMGVAEESTGRIRTKHVPNVRKGTVYWLGSEWLDMPNVDLHTDQLNSYAFLGECCAGHRTVDHRVAYVQDGISTNRMETPGAFSLAL